MIIICGPTAIGKTAHAVDLALKEDAEIISADSGQIYRGLDIGTAKPTREERGQVLFHLIDLIDPSEQFNAADFRRVALQKIEEIQSRGKKVIITGGTGLYIKVLEEGIFDGPAADPKIRSVLEKRVEQEGILSLHRELQKVDPMAAAKIPSKNRQRIIRALEVYKLTGKPISEHWREHSLSPSPRPSPIKGEGANVLKIGLTMEREDLYQRIDKRIDRMIQQGWIEETVSLLKKWGAEAPGFKLIGYKEIVDHLRGKISRKATIDLIKTHTHQYAKRQLTWFKRDPKIRWVTLGQTGS